MTDYVTAAFLGFSVALIVRFLQGKLRSPRQRLPLSSVEYAPPETCHGVGMSAVALSRVDRTIIVAPWLDY